MLFALDICVKKKAPPTHSVHWGLNPSPFQKHDSVFCEIASYICKLSKPPFLGDLPSPPPPPKKIFFSCTLPTPHPCKKIGFFSEFP